jgi:hypothetical protein
MLVPGKLQIADSHQNSPSKTAQRTHPTFALPELAIFALEFVFDGVCCCVQAIRIQARASTPVIPVTLNHEYFIYVLSFEEN